MKCFPQIYPLGWVILIPQDGIPLTDPKFYSQITSVELDHILRSDNPDAKVPMLEKRTSCLQEVGKQLMEKYQGKC
jgi:hypothetical protein